MSRLPGMILLVLCAFVASTAAAEPPLPDDYSANYGDGLRYYAEGRHDLALKHLYRAYAAKPSENLLRLIIRTHDFMGHCSAAERQIGLFTELYRSGRAPELQLCASPGTLVLECTPPKQSVLIDRQIVASCGSSIKLPPGNHRIDADMLKDPEHIEIRSDQKTVAKLTLDPEKWPPPVRRIRAKVPRLEGERYTVFQTEDGLYQIWVRSDLSRDPDMNPGSKPGFTIIRRPDGLYDISSDALREPFEGQGSSGSGGTKKPGTPVPMLPLD